MNIRAPWALPPTVLPSADDEWQNVGRPGPKRSWARQASAAPPPPDPSPVVVVVVEWLYYSERIIIDERADLSELFSLIFVGKMCVFVSRPMKKEPPEDDHQKFPKLEQKSSPKQVPRRMNPAHR